MMQAGGEQDQSLVETANRAALDLPDFLPGLVSVEKLPGVPLGRALREFGAVFRGNRRLERKLFGPGRDLTHSGHQADRLLRSLVSEDY